MLYEFLCGVECGDSVGSDLYRTGHSHRRSWLGSWSNGGRKRRLVMKPPLALISGWNSGFLEEAPQIVRKNMEYLRNASLNGADDEAADEMGKEAG